MLEHLHDCVFALVRQTNMSSALRLGPSNFAGKRTYQESEIQVGFGKMPGIVMSVSTVPVDLKGILI